VETSDCSSSPMSKLASADNYTLRRLKSHQRTHEIHLRGFHRRQRLRLLLAHSHTTNSRNPPLWTSRAAATGVTPGPQSSQRTHEIHLRGLHGRQRLGLLLDPCHPNEAHNPPSWISPSVRQFFLPPAPNRFPNPVVNDEAFDCLYTIS